LEFDELSNRVIGCAIEVHRQLGPGLLESVYTKCLDHELRRTGIESLTEHPFPVRYKGIELDCGFRMDILVENVLIVELKAVDTLLPIHEAQLLTHLRMTKLKVGRLMNFNTRVIRTSIRRMVL
jgi:GxxExxY protein